MQRPSRFSALFASMLVVAGLLLSSGYRCPLQSRGMSMPGMDTVDAVAPASATLAGTRSSPSTPDSGRPCDAPTAPEGCQSMVACAPAAISVERVVLLEAVRERTPVVVAAFLKPLSEIQAPELPPPRA